MVGQKLPKWLEREITQANKCLKRVSLRVRSGNLYIRFSALAETGTLKQWEKNTGYPATKQGLVYAQRLASEISQELIYGGGIDWTRWDKQPPPETIGDWIERMKIEHWQEKPRSPTAERSFHGDYLVPCYRLPRDRVLTAEILKSEYLKTKPGSRSRIRYARAYNKLAATAGVTLHLPTRGYKPSTKIECPSDREIEFWGDSIPDEGWRRAYGLIATFCLRPSEVWFLDVSEIRNEVPMLHILAGKTGERWCTPPSNPEWIERWELWKWNPTKDTKVRDFDRPGQCLNSPISRAFIRYNIPFLPKSLRHAGAIRHSLAGDSPVIAAREMGHSERVHSEIYHQHFNRKHLEEAYRMRKLR